MANHAKRRKKTIKKEVRRAFLPRLFPLLKMVGEPRRQSWVLFVLLLVLGFILHNIAPIPMDLPYVISYTGWIPVTVALMLITVGHVISHPRKGERLTTRPKLITSGLYSYTRNPIYLGFCMFFIGMGIAAGWFWFLVMGVLLPVAIHTMVLPDEEKTFLEYYGDRYRDYMKRTPRWL